MQNEQYGGEDQKTGIITILDIFEEEPEKFKKTAKIITMPMASITFIHFLYIQYGVAFIFIHQNPLYKWYNFQ